MWTARLTLFALFLLSNQPAAAQQTEHAPGGIPLLSQAGIEQLIRREHITSVEQLLPQLPLWYRSSYALAFHSRSLQEASYSNPRVILFGRTGKFILTFNGDPQQAGYDALELVEFADADKTFRYQEIQFPRAGEVDQQVSFSGLNPPKCTACHGTHVRPIWDAMPTWPGMYGERYQQHLSAAENEGLARFLNLQPEHPRYRYLANLDAWRSGELFTPSHAAIYNGTQNESPNAQLTLLLTRLNAERITHQVTQDEHFPEFQFSLLASLSNSCAALSDYFPASWYERLQQSYQQFEQTDGIHLVQQQQRKLSREQVSQSGRLEKSSTLLDFRFIAELGLQIDTSEWSMQLEKNAADFSAIDSMQQKLEQRLLTQIASRDSELMNAWYFHAYPDNNKYCRYLAKRSRQYLQDRPVPTLPVWTDKSSGVVRLLAGSDPDSDPGNSSATGLLRICAACHTTGVAPALPFDQPELLRKKLAQPYSEQGSLLATILYRLSENAGARRMPPTMNLTAREQHTLEQYFSSLGRSELNHQ